jgi:O-methyltransferase involved in polyketide biosynthesis
VLQLGCGLDSRFLRVDDGRVNWYDLDMPPVVELRHRFFTESERCHMIAASVTDLEWVDTVPYDGQPVLVVAEGLLMYLDEADVRRLVLRLHETFPGCRLIADVFSRLTARSAANHPALKFTAASIGWGIDDPCELEAWNPVSASWRSGISLTIPTWPVSTMGIAWPTGWLEPSRWCSGHTASCTTNCSLRHPRTRIAQECGLSSFYSPPFLESK